MNHGMYMHIFKASISLDLLSYLYIYSYEDSGNLKKKNIMYPDNMVNVSPTER